MVNTKFCIEDVLFVHESQLFYKYKGSEFAIIVSVFIAGTVIAWRDSVIVILVPPQYFSGFTLNPLTFSGFGFYLKPLTFSGQGFTTTILSLCRVLLLLTFSLLFSLTLLSHGDLFASLFGDGMGLYTKLHFFTGLKIQLLEKTHVFDCLHLKENL